MGKQKTVGENLEFAAELFLAAIGGYAMIRGVDVVRQQRAERAEPIPEHVRVAIGGPAGSSIPGPSGGVIDAEFVEAMPAELRARR